jgi:hypothetical protein
VTLCKLLALSNNARTLPIPIIIGGKRTKIVGIQPPRQNYKYFTYRQNLNLKYISDSIINLSHGLSKAEIYLIPVGLGLRSPKKS